MRCGCCGQDLAGIVFQDDYRLLIHNGRGVPLGFIPYRVAKLVHQQYRSISDLVELLYPGPNGGPDYARDGIWATISVANKKLASIGLQIKSDRKGRGAKIGLVHVA